MSNTVNREIRAYRTRIDTIGGVTQPQVNDGYFLSTRNRLSRARVNTPDFRKRRSRKQWLPVNDYHLVKETVEFPGGDSHLVLTWIPNGDQSVYSGPDPDGFGSTGYLSITDSYRSSSVDRLKNKCLEKIKDQKINLGVFFAEREKLFSMIADTARTFAKAYNQLRAGKVANAARTLNVGLRPSVTRKKGAANQWLQLQYGWRPLLNDIHGAAEDLANYLYRYEPPLKKVVASATYSESDYVDSAPGDLTTSLRKVEGKITAGYYYTVDVQASWWLGHLGLTNPASIAWEVVPYSFVVDWFLPVGNYLNCLDATLGCSFRDGFTAEKNRSEIRLTRLGVKVSGNFRYQYSVGGLAVLETYTRVRELDFPAVSLPQPKNPLSAQHVANALALLTQAFSKR